MSKKKIRVDGGYLNALVPMRGRMSNYGAEMMNGGFLLPEAILRSSYIHNGFARLICDKPAEEMTRAGFKLKDVSEELEQDVKSELERLDAIKKLAEGLKWRRAFGGGLIVLGLRDGSNDLKEPVNEDSLEAIEFMRVYDRFEAFEESSYDDPMDVNYGKIEFWKIQPKAGGTGYTVHESRVLIFDGESVPNDIRIGNQGWGASAIQNCFPQLARLDSAHKWSLLLLERMQQAVHGIPNLSEQVATPEGEQQVTKRVDVVDKVRGALNTVVIDALETYEIKSMSLSGVSDVVDRLAEALSAVSGIATFVLMGRSASGLNNGDSSAKAWNAQISAWQNDQLRKPLDKLISLIIRTLSKGATDGGKYTLEFNPLSALTDLEEADIETKKESAKKSKADTLAVYISNQVMDPDEAREVIREEYNLQGAAPEPELEEPAPITLNPGQKLVAPTPGQHNPAPVGKK